MRYYFAPMEGLTDGIFRRLHHKYFPGVDRYYTPFFSPTIHRSLTPKEARELPVAESVDFCVIPQLLTKVPADFLWMAEQCSARGYQEVNLNLGCPSGTVTAKQKGAGMLRDLDALDRFLDEIFLKRPIAISIKTRIGFSSSEEFPALLDIFNQYPVKELIVHPRVRSQFYGGAPDMDAFTHAVKYSNNPLCYNGDLQSLTDVSKFSNKYTQVDAVMIGRGLLSDPGMVTPGGTDVKTLEAFFEELLDEYLSAFGGSRNAMFRLKEHWNFLIQNFEGAEMLSKRLRKTTDLGEYKAITQEIFHTLPFKN